MNSKQEKALVAGLLTTSQSRMDTDSDVILVENFR